MDTLALEDSPGLLAGLGAKRLTGSGPARRISHYRRELARIRAWRGDAGPDREWRARLLLLGLEGDRRIEVCALVDRACREHLALAPFDSQWLAALMMIDGRVVEMATGEGKTLVAGLAAAVTALAGRRVHVITANEYLVGRDAEWLRPLYSALGLLCAAAHEGVTPTERRKAYRADVVYACARTVVFDWLRDRAAGHPEIDSLDACARRLVQPNESGPVLPALDLAFVDEADSVLIDEASVPLVLSAERRDADSRSRWWQAWRLAGELAEGEHFQLDHAARVAHLSAAAGSLLGQAPGRWLSRRHLDECVEMALVARHLYHRDADYLVRDGEVCIVDPVSGRIAEGRVWSRGLHALIALKEGLRPPADSETLAQTTYQRFFPRYRAIAGMSGTLSEVRRELVRCYGLSLMRVPTHRRCIRVTRPTRLLADEQELADALVATVSALVGARRAVLIGTDSVGASRQVAAMLSRADIEHCVLNADQSRHEADVVADAGEAGRVTVATNMAGRGTDIRLAADAQAHGGLHVLSLQINPSRRLDRQLAGRCARQGDPGSFEQWLVASLMNEKRLPLIGVCSTLLGVRLRTLATGTARLALACHQIAGERRSSRDRARLLARDEAWDERFGIGNRDS